MNMTMAVTAEFDPDLPVIEALRAGDEEAFAELWRRHHRWARGVILAILGDPGCVDDVAQRAWCTVWERIDTLRDPRRWRGWLYRLVRNAAIDARRDRRRVRQTTEQYEARDGRGNGGGRPEQHLMAAEQLRIAMDAIRALPAKYREPFVLRHLEDWSYRQIAETLGMPVDTVETRLVRARRLLCEALAGKV
jgi:RNA polymerase sigma-70 factor (ECF subfamily)